MFKVLTKRCEPTKDSKYSAGIDLYASEDVVIGAGETKIIGLGVCIDEHEIYDLTNRLQRNGNVCYDFDDFKSSHYLELHPRSSLRAKGLISNTGIIDLDYKDEIKIIIHNPFNPMLLNGEIIGYAENSYAIKKGDKIAQILLKEHKSYLLGVESEEERTGGFRSNK